METWLDEHLETFVRPQLRCIPAVNQDDIWIKTFKLKTVSGMIALWNRTKVLAKGRTILLPGRDVFLFEVVARMQGDYPTIFRPEISSAVAPYVAEDYTDTFVLDTGYRGSIPLAMKIPNWALVRYGSGSPEMLNVKKYQVFPKATKGVFTSLSPTLEGCPKYWTRAYMDAAGSVARGTYGELVYQKGGKFIQTIDTDYFDQAARLTIHVATLVKTLKPFVRCLRPPQGRLF